MNRFKPVIQYLLIAFLLPLLCLRAESVCSNSTAVLVLYGIRAASPCIAAVTVIKLLQKDSLQDYFNIRLTLQAVILPCVLVCGTMLAAKSIWVLRTGSPLRMDRLSSRQLLVIAWSLIAEEAGWRGLLEPSLRRLMKRQWAAVPVTGLIWTAWHYHFFLQNGMEVPLLLFAAGAITESYLYSFFMEASGRNLLTAAVYHFSWNLFMHLFMIGPGDNGGSTGPYATVIVLELLTVLVWLAASHRKNTAGHG